MTSESPFECTKCGDCCRNLSDERMVILFPDENKVLADGLGIEVEEFKEYTEEVRIFEELGITAERLKSIDENCVFLTHNNLCKIHSFKPYQCRSGPDQFLTKWRSDYSCINSDLLEYDEEFDIELFRLFVN